MFQFRQIAAAAALVCAMPFASAAVLTFDNLSGTAFFTSDYQGFRFGTNSAATNAFFYTNDPTYPALSGSTYVTVDNTIYDSTNFYQGTTAASGIYGGLQQLITSSTPFTFDSAFFASSRRPGESIGYKLYVGSTVVFTSTPTVLLASGDYTQVFSGYSGLITGVEIFGHQGYYAMDNFTYNVTPVPEPSIYALMLAGLAGVATIVRRRSV